jgi:hypothetical protein
MIYRNDATARREAIVRAMMAVSNPPPQVQVPQAVPPPQQPTAGPAVPPRVPVAAPLPARRRLR